MASYYCRGGGKFALLGPSKLKCLADGSWDADNPPSCIGRGDKASQFVERLRGRTLAVITNTTDYFLHHRDFILPLPDPRLLAQCGRHGQFGAAEAEEGGAGTGGTVAIAG